MIGVVEHDHPGTTRGSTCDLHRVLQGLRAGAEQGGALGELPRGQLVEPIGHVDVALVLGDEEAGMSEPGDLLLNARDHPWSTGAHAGHRNTRGEIDEVVAVDVDEDAPTRPFDEYRQGRANAGRKDLLTTQLPLAGEWAGQFGAQDSTLLRHVGARVGRILQCHVPVHSVHGHRSSSGPEPVRGPAGPATVIRAATRDLG